MSAPTTLDIKQRIRAGLHDLPAAWKRLNEAIDQRLAEIEADRRAGISPIPELDFRDLERPSSIDVATIKSRGCVIIRNVFDRKLAEAWNREVEDYLQRNDYLGQQVHAEDNYFGDLANSKPQVYGIYWSKPQIAARQHEHMYRVQCFLNGLWEDHGLFEQNQILTYADRIRMREPQDTTFGLSPHLDSGSVERWTEPNYRHTYRAIFEGRWEAYDPFDVGSRLQVEFIPSPAVCRAFRCFQGWTALTAQGEGDGTLQVVPMLKESTSYLLLRPLLEDVPADNWCDSKPLKAFVVNEKWHAPLLRGVCSIPLLHPGDTVWWHPDMIHSVEQKHTGSHYSNVMFIGATPDCEKNRRYMELQKPAFLAGKSAPDFAAEDREVHYQNRARYEDLTPLGRKAMGFEAW